jgi:hypothetical protein
VIEREARPDRGFDYPQDDPYEDDGWFGRELVTDSISVDEVAELQAANPSTTSAKNATNPRHLPDGSRRPRSIPGRSTVSFAPRITAR